MKPTFFLLLLFFIFFLVFQACQTKDREDKTRVSIIKNPPLEQVFDKETFDLQGHRGCRGVMPENTVQGFLKALDFGVKTLEMDVVISKDSFFIVSHEPYFSSMITTTPKGDSILPKDERKFNIYQMTKAEIQAFDVGKRKHIWFPKQEKITATKPTLMEVVVSVEQKIKKNKLGKIIYNIEAKCSPDGDTIFHPKPKPYAKMMLEEIKRLKIKDRIMVQSFDTRFLKAFRELDDEIPLVLLVENSLSLRDNIEQLGFAPAVYSPQFKLVNQDMLKEAHELGIKVIPWTVNDTEDMQKMKNMGVNGLITDYPDRFQQLLK
ncbi:MAG: glycerophosphodiester phosphodiesterase [Bacteroidetes bacterium]|nr:MAG: glycerophosphodiester phosphodiesterase [Bacteroidota bacterium]TAG95887.1 MAG: glycerophosphodiester phosphodiesterase [Bacteroidota bacterium]